MTNYNHLVAIHFVTIKAVSTPVTTIVLLLQHECTKQPVT